MLYYILFTILFIVYEFRNLSNPHRLINLKKQVDSLKSIEGDQRQSLSKEIIQEYFGIIIFNFFYAIWCIIGILLYPEWYLFLFLVFFSYFSSFISSRLISLDKPLLYYKIIDSIVSLLILSLVLISYFSPIFYKNLI